MLFGFSFSAIASTGDITAESFPFKVDVDSQNSTTADLTVRFNLQKEVSKEIATSETVKAPLSLDGPVASESGDWKNYWHELSSNEESRAQSLSVAIKGLDQATALLIVRNGLFMFRPRFWSEFDQQMRNAESALKQMGFAAHFYDVITVQFGSDNSHALGFWVVTHIPAGILSRHYIVRAVNPVLQSFKQDNFNIILGYDANAVTVDGHSTFNTW